MSYDLDLDDLTQYIKEDVTADFICAVTHYLVNGLELPKYAGKSDISIDVRTYLLNRYVTDNSTVVKSLTPYHTVEQVRDMLNRQ